MKLISQYNFVIVDMHNMYKNQLQFYTQKRNISFRYIPMSERDLHMILSFGVRLGLLEIPMEAKNFIIHYVKLSLQLLELHICHYCPMESL